ncbi:alpha/beta hydrolase [Massilia sp. W12]|uniref:alpha/beta fold hydrolase n=1 Tax=Massilia sp. W12 TaxID=3126507 RepID=UPI0030CD1DF9
MQHISRRQGIKTMLAASLAALSFGAIVSNASATIATTLPPGEAPIVSKTSVLHKNIKVGDVDVFYREAGDKNAPTIVLLHGFPTSSQMFRNLIPQLARQYHVIAPDFPGFGKTQTPAGYVHSFDNIAKVVEGLLQAKGVARYSMYVFDYGAPVGWRLALANPSRVDSFIIQNGNAYEEGLREFWDPFRTYWKNNDAASRNALAGFLNLGATQWQYTHGQPVQALISPDPAVTDQYYLDQGNNKQVQLDLFYDYRTNLAVYPRVQAYFRSYQPKTLIVWGRNDQIFPFQGAEAYKKDLVRPNIHYLDGGHFVLESHGAQVAKLSMDFLKSVYGK